MKSEKSWEQRLSLDVTFLGAEAESGCDYTGNKKTLKIKLAEKRERF